MSVLAGIWARTRAFLVKETVVALGQFEIEPLTSYFVGRVQALARVDAGFEPVCFGPSYLAANRPQR